MGDVVLEGRFYSGFGNVYDSLGDFEEVIKNYEKDLFVV